MSDRSDERMPPAPLPRVNVLGVGIHATNLAEATSQVIAAARDGRRGYVCVTGAHGIIESQSDPELRRIHNRSFLTVPDGMPTVWVGRARGNRRMGRVYGPDLMAAVLEASVADGMTHFLYGGGPGVAEALRARLTARLPGLQIVGAFTPPFRPLTPDEEQALQDQVALARPHIFWVGLSTPKQERFMAAHVDRLDAGVMLGVGAAFDMLSGRIQDAPDWVKGAGLQWLHRLVREPRRLGSRYFNVVPRFLLGLCWQGLGIRRHSIEE